MKNLFTVWLMFVCFSAIAQQSFSIHGTVKTESGEAVAGATVFIANSKYVTATDKEGKFSLDGLRPGNYEVVIRMIGFKPLMQDVVIHEKSLNILASLTESNTTLKTVRIRAYKLTSTQKANYL